jgi:hypothetical protein
MTTLTKAMFWLGLSMAAVGARPPSALAEPELGRDEMIAACVENREKSYECKDPFIDAMIDLRLSRLGKTLSPGERNAMKSKGLEEITEDGSGPLAPRQAKCAAMVDHLGKKQRKVANAKLDALKGCYAETDCKRRVECMMPIMAELMFPKTG